jgi:hypothetical protein
MRCQSRLLLQSVASLLALGYSLPALGVDTAPVQGLDGRATGHVLSADTLGEGRVSSSVMMRGALDAVSARAYGAGTDAVLDRSHLAVAHLGLGLGERFELGLGLRGTYENVSHQAVKDHRAQGFSGGSAMLKTRLWSGDGFGLSLAPFVESGAGKRGASTLTREEKPMAGWLVMATLGARGPVELSLNGGWRYRDGADVVGIYKIRNEAIYQAALTFHATRWADLFLAGQGRRLMIAEGAKADYEGQTGGDLTAGLSLKSGDLTVSAWGGRNVKKDSFGFARRTAGLSLSWSVETSGTPGFARSLAEESGSAETSQVASRPASIYPDEMNGEFDPMAELAKAKKSGKLERDDFDMIEERMAAQRAKGTQSIAFEDELVKYRADEARREAELAKRRALVERSDRERAATAARQDQSRRVRYGTEARRAAAALPSTREIPEYGLE